MPSWRCRHPSGSRACSGGWAPCLLSFQFSLMMMMMIHICMTSWFQRALGFPRALSYCTYCSLYNVQCLFWPTLGTCSLTGITELSVRPYNSGICVKQEAQIMRPAEHWQVTQIKKEEEMTSSRERWGTANWNACSAERWGRLLLLLYPPTFPMWKYEPSAARTSNALRDVKGQMLGKSPSY